ncbi:MAG: putative sugar O-methyltransferase [Chloroflexi bacterium]|nr:putative sugar O-methyltransferase [Chloroflexota bacterium]
MDTLEQIKHLRDSGETKRAFSAYTDIREWFIELTRDPRFDSNTPSDFWSTELDTYGYMLEATPLLVGNLRHHTTDITGLRAFPYRHGRDTEIAQFRAKRDAVAALSKRDLFVPESPHLGGFGHDIDGDLINIDTLKFFEVLVGMERGRVIKDVFDSTETRRPSVLEIGAGWGGFAYQVKTLFPNTTYVIADLPLMMLYSATYLKVAFPEAKMVFYQDPSDLADTKLWESADFVFLPHYAIDELPAGKTDLAVNICSFMEMSNAQVSHYVNQLRSLECSLIYSLNRDRSPWNQELGRVSEILREGYSTEELHLLPIPYNFLNLGDGVTTSSNLVTRGLNNPLKVPAYVASRAKAKFQKGSKVSGQAPPEREYRHIVGRLI